MQKLELNAAAIRNVTDLHIKLKIPFEVTLTNYTTKIVSKLTEVQFMKNAQSSKVFIAYQKLKQDIQGKPKPDVDMRRLKYYSSNLNPKFIYADTIFNIDIKSAYASILYNDNVISRDTFNYIMGLPKLDRLATVGMLAGRKNIFQFNENGKIESSVEIVSETANFFFYAVQRTYEIMNRCKGEIYDDFIFSWVDGIYFGRPCSSIVVRDVLAQFGLKCSFDALTDFEVKDAPDYIVLTYIKDDERKVFNLPKQNNVIRETLYNFLANKDYQNKVEKSKITKQSFNI